MEKRKFGIPAIALGFTALTLTACPVDDDKDEDEDEEEDEDAAGIDGSWSLEAYSYEGTAYPLENTYEYYGYVYTTALGVTLTIAAPTVDAVLNTSYYTDNPANSDSNGDESTSYSGTISDNSDGTYGIDIEDFINMDCTDAGATLECEGNSDYTGLSLTFSRD